MWATICKYRFGRTANLGSTIREHRLSSTTGPRTKRESYDSSAAGLRKLTTEACEYFGEDSSRKRVSCNSSIHRIRIALISAWTPRKLKSLQRCLAASPCRGTARSKESTRIDGSLREVYSMKKTKKLTLLSLTVLLLLRVGAICAAEPQLPDTPAAH